MRKIRISALVVAFSVATFYLTPIHRVMASGVQALASVLAGGTGRTSLTANTVLVGEGTAPVNQVGPGTAGQCLESNGAGVDPSFGTCATGAGAVYSQTSSITVGNTVTETSVITGATGSGSPTLSAGFFTAGKTIRVVVWGYHSATAAPTIEWKMKLGAVTVLDTTAVASNNSTNQEILAQGYITCRTTGAAGTFFSQGRYEELTHLDSQMVNTTAATVDTTASQLVDVTVQWGTAAVGNTVTVTNVSIETVGGGSGGGLTCAGGIGSAPSGCLIEEHTAAASVELDFTTCISSTYDNYEVDLVNILPATNNVDILWQASTNGGATYDTGANYVSQSWLFVSNATANSGSTTATGVSLSGKNGNGVGNSHSGVTGEFRLYAPGSVNNKLIAGTVEYEDGTTGLLNTSTVGGRYTSATAVNAFRVIATTGNLTSGAVRCYGITK